MSLYHELMYFRALGRANARQSSAEYLHDTNVWNACEEWGVNPKTNHGAAWMEGYLEVKHERLEEQEEQQ